MVTPATPPPGPGSTFGPYRIDSTIGVGAMGIVYLAVDQRLGRRVALKVVIGHLAQSPEFVERFQREAASLARLESPHVVQIFDHGVENGVPFIATQYAAGGDLSRLLAQRGPMPPVLAAELCSQVADALRDAHRVGVIHRDVKPANVLLRDDRLDRVHVLLCDFGVARTEGGQLTEPGSVRGTWNYLAPERISGTPGSAASDIYAVGCLLWEVLTGRPPFDGNGVDVARAHQQAPVPQLPGTDAFTQHANRILAGTLAKSPEQRYRSASVLRDDLRSLAGIPSRPPAPPVGQAPAYAPGAASGPIRSRKPVRAWWIAAAAVAVLAVGAGTVVAVDAGGDDDPSTDETAGPADPGPATPSDPSAEASEPSQEPTEGVPTPDTSGAVRGDLDGDGLGDLGLLTLDGLRVMTSDGSTLADADLRRNRQGLTGLSGDVDNDGRVDIVRIQNEPPRMTASLSSAGAATSPISTPDSPEILGALDVPMSLGDVDGDGNLDLVALTRLSATTAQVDVALGDGTGVFAATTAWYSGPLAEPEGGIYVADADGDAISDVVHVSVGRTTDSNPQATLLRSDGGALAVTGDITAVDAGGFAVGTVRVGDVDGDGVDDLVATTADGLRINVWSWNGATFDQTPWYDDSDSLEVPGTTGFTLSDVDGDGFDDVVSIGTDDDLDEVVGAVFLSDGLAFTPAPGWERSLQVDTSYNLLDQNVNSPV